MNRFFSRTGLTIWIAAVAGALLVMPYVNHLTPGALQLAAARMRQPVFVIVLLSMIQNAVVLGFMTFTGLWAARKLGMGAPLVDRWLDGTAVGFDWRRGLFTAVGLGLLCGLILIALDVLVFLPLSPHGVGHLDRSATPPAWTGFLASFEGGLTEEVEMRLFALSFIALGIRYIRDRFGAERGSPLPTAIFWTANIVAAVLFGLGHLPVTAHLVHLTPLIVTRAVVLNGIVGVVAGYLFWRRGIEMAMTCHFSADIVLHVLGAVIAPHIIASSA